MKKLIEMLLENLSTREFFLFRIACGACGREYANKPVRFSKAGEDPGSAQKKILFDAVYEQEFQNAKIGAIRNTVEHLNYCPICKRLICNRCFLICDDLDMCKQCAAHLQEEGSPVLADVVDAEI